MRIAIDGRLYGPVKNKGLGRYVEQLVNNLEKIDPEPVADAPVKGKCSENEYVVLLSRENWGEYEPSNPRFNKVLVDYKWYSLAEQVFLPFKLWRLKPDLVHFPHFNVPLFYFGRFVVTIHDLIMYKFPDERATTKNKLVYKIKYWLHKVVVKSAVRRAERVITVSEWTKRDVVREFDVDADKIVVTYLGFEVGDKVNTVVNTMVNKVVNKFGIKKPYLLYVGNAYPHKNLERLIEAFGIVREQEHDVQLVLVGKGDYFYGELISESVNKGTENIIFTDFVSNGELVELYKNALLYVFPSLYEGFGLPGLEAMAYRVPVVSSRTSCLPEIYGEAAVYFDPESVEDMAEKIGKVLSDDELREELVGKGLEQIKKYSWRKCAEETLEVYTQVE